MPKRTNEFQKLVALVERLAASSTPKVLESAMVLSNGMAINEAVEKDSDPN